jgi:hypothetical protein
LRLIIDLAALPVLVALELRNNIIVAITNHQHPFPDRKYH